MSEYDLSGLKGGGGMGGGGGGHVYRIIINLLSSTPPPSVHTLTPAVACVCVCFVVTRGKRGKSTLC